MYHGIKGHNAMTMPPPPDKDADKELEKISRYIENEDKKKDKKEKGLWRSLISK